MENIKNAELTTAAAIASYGIGRQMGNQLVEEYLDVDFNALCRGIYESLEAEDLQVSEQQIAQAVNELYVAAKAKKEQDFAAFKDAGIDFLKDNATKANVVTTATGLQYEVVTRSDSDVSPKATDKVTVHYSGSLINGKEFDSSYKRGEPASFPLNGVIPGWTEGLQLMHVGDKYRLYIPYELAYGERGAGEVIPPFSTLVFEVELISID